MRSEVYGLPILAVREIIRPMEITRIPRTPPFVRGLINLRGRVVPVQDLGLRLGMEPAIPSDHAVIIVVQCESDGGTPDVGILVDEVHDVIDLEAGQIAPAPSLGSGQDTGFLRGVGLLDQRVLFLLDVHRAIHHGDDPRPGVPGGT